MGFISDVVKVGTGGLIDLDAGDDAAAAQLAATDKQIEENARQYDQTREDWMPFRDIGLQNFQNLNRLANSPDQTPEGRLARIRSSFQASPGFQNRLKLGLDQIQQGAAAQGTLFSGNTLKGMEDYRQNLASDEFNNYTNLYNSLNDTRLNRIAGLAGAGQASTAQITNAGQNYSNNLNQIYQNQGDIRAAQAMGPTNTLLNFANAGANIAGAFK